MILDPLNIFVLKEILSSKNTTTWKIAKKYNWSDKPNIFLPMMESRFYSKKDSLIVGRLKIMSREGLIKITKEENKNVYEVDGKKVILRKHKFPNKVADAIIVKDSSNKWICVEI